MSGNLKSFVWPGAVVEASRKSVIAGSARERRANRFWVNKGKSSCKNEKWMLILAGLERRRPKLLPNLLRARMLIGFRNRQCLNFASVGVPTLVGLFSAVK